MDSNFLVQLGLLQTPKVRVYDNACLYYFNMVTTILFLVGHLALMMFVFDYWNRGDWLIIVYSML